MPDSLVPKTVSVFREGYGAARLKADAFAGLTVAIVALPLSMAIAIASGVTPDRGLYTAIVGGFLVSLLGGSRVQIGGPAGAFIVLVAATGARHGLDGLLLATAMSGVMLVAAGYLRLGNYIKFIPYPVTVGFTAGIAVIIFASQLRDLFGLTLSGREPGPIIEKVATLGLAAGTVNWAAVLTAALTIGIILALRKLRPHWPGMLIAVAAASAFVALLQLPTETIGTRFGGIPRGLPSPTLPPFSLEKAAAVFPDAVSFALLGAIESLLSAVVADGMTGRRHRSSMELIAQGTANFCSALFGGICVTGTIARTATNVRAGGTSPVSGMLHSIFLLLFMLLAAPLASYIPLASLAGVLAVVAWNMIEKPAFMALLRSSYGDAVVLLATFIIVVFRELTEGIVIGFALGAVLFIDRMAKSISVGETKPLEALKEENGEEEHPVVADDPDTVIYRISGIFFFGSAATVGTVLDRIADQRRNFILDCSEVPFMDSTAANVIEGTLRKAERTGVRFFITGARSQVRRTLRQHDVRPPRVVMRASVQAALASIRSEKSA
ncbi:MULTISPECIES: SulP family inorganic anion transporter [unclassified Sinorhizobium]|uniref:SulP family inorganic anion transporter n=1 Tax=unclassified Sinorhizobium TaxID=2613772 RepID=UPI0024C2B5D2|nr:MULTISPECIES: SulP family inorganic anion transporter [unclassified Sinorhizobium]MDK1373067.1 SulP family inorganic anion transporter [Sinorhizobium sp. 6-70]MDK1482810.1 SulP family inorganic anion transporter [Sinorhizobium sp. 6-117]